MKELELIKGIRKKVGKPSGGLATGIGDDCAVIEKDKNNFFVWGADMIIEDTHFRIKDGYERIGRKAVAVNISDIAAMGAEPKYITVSIGVPQGIKMPDVMKVYSGINGICREYGVQVVGGDTVKSSKLIIDVSIIGVVSKKKLITRSGARPGDLILVTGPVRNGKKQHLDFIPRLSESRFLVEGHKPSAMIDVSDGIAPDIGRICEESKVGCFLYEESIPLTLGLTAEDALYYGESFELLFTMSDQRARRLPPRADNPLFSDFFVIGKVTGSFRGKKMMLSSGRTIGIKMTGYDHLPSV